MNPITPRNCVDRGWTKIRYNWPRDQQDEVVEWIEHNIGSMNWSVWFGDFYFEEPAHATLFGLRWVK